MDNYRITIDIIIKHALFKEIKSLKGACFSLERVNLFENIYMINEKNGGDTVAGLWNVNSIYNSSMKKISSKLTFQLGETFSARVVSLKVDKSEGIIKLLDGWQFPAKVEQPLDVAIDELVKFQVVGFEDGKLKIKLASSSSDKEADENNSIDSILAENNIDSEEYNILEKMIRHNMPLTKENISKIKSLKDFLQKLSSENSEETEFIKRYMESKNISVNTPQGEKIKDLLKEFLKEFRKISIDDILTLLENNIELNTENIESFNKIFKGSMEIYKASETIGKGLENIEPLNYKTDEIFSFDHRTGELEVYSENSEQKTEDKSYSIPIKGIMGFPVNYVLNSNSSKISNVNIMDLLKKASKENYELKKDIKEIIVDNSNNISEEELGHRLEKLEKFPEDRILDILKSIMNSKNENISMNSNSPVVNDTGLPTKEDALELFKVIFGEDIEISEDKVENFLNAVSKLIAKDSRNGLIRDSIDKNTSDIIKEQIKMKTDEIKSIIKEVIKKSIDTKSEMYSRVVDLVKNSINDFKVFNTVSNNYYYMDLPVAIQDNEYPCKLIIKDERSKGKKIDSKNVKLVVSIKTINMGTIDGYIRVKDLNMNIEIKCDDTWIKVLDMAKEKLMNKLKDNGYNINLTISKREKEVNLTNCREFFEDFGLNNIDIKV